MRNFSVVVACDDSDILHIFFDGRFRLKVDTNVTAELIVHGVENGLVIDVEHVIFIAANTSVDTSILLERPQILDERIKLRFGQFTFKVDNNSVSENHDDNLHKKNEFDASATDYSTVVTIDATKAASLVNVIGNAKANVLIANAQGATLSGGTGNDTLRGGEGADLFVYEAGKDVIQNYTGGADTVSVGGDASVSNFSVSKTGDVILTVGKGTITVKKLADEDIADGKEITITDANGTSTKTYYTNRAATSKGVTLNSAFTGAYTAGSGIVTVDAALVTKAIALTGNSVNQRRLWYKSPPPLHNRALRESTPKLRYRQE